ncbi:hypothetical protein AGDE_01785 [Angomonas deanei]|nr:hypothetical protein AGDE_01785 [Angomonas deanei]|eukprot:EPY42138.1 hypothetical protein AGDE_01785 [Angomonas deanei]
MLTMYTCADIVFLAQLRGLVRERYQIRGTLCRDCTGAFCCRCCLVQQMLLEMTSVGDFPGATCYSVPKETTMA